MPKPIVAITHEQDAVTRHFPDEDLARLRTIAELRVVGGRASEGFAKRLAEADILLGSWGMPKLTEELLEQAPRLRAVCYAAGSVKGFVTEAAYRRGLIITTAMHANAIPVAEVTTALITLANKDWFGCLATIDAQGPGGYRVARNAAHPGNFETAVGLIGFGAIGRLVLERLRMMDLRVQVYDPHVSAQAILDAGGEPVTELPELAAGCRTISLHAPNIPACEGMIDADFFRSMQDGGIFINTARGKLVDEDALIAELRTGRISAHLDVTSPEPPEAGHPFYSLPNCHLTPHRAGSSSAEIKRMGRWAIAEVHRIIDGQPPQHQVHEEMLATMA